MCLGTNIVKLGAQMLFPSLSLICLRIFSSFQYYMYFKSFKQDRYGRGRLWRYSSVLENASVISQAYKPHHRRTNLTNGVQTSLSTSSPPTSTSCPEQVQDDSLPLIRQILQKSGNSSRHCLHHHRFMAERNKETIRLPPPIKDIFLLSTG